MAYNKNNIEALLTDQGMTTDVRVIAVTKMANGTKAVRFTYEEKDDHANNQVGRFEMKTAEKKGVAASVALVRVQARKVGGAYDDISATQAPDGLMQLTRDLATSKQYMLAI